MSSRRGLVRALVGVGLATWTLVAQAAPPPELPVPESRPAPPVELPPAAPESRRAPPADRSPVAPPVLTTEVIFLQSLAPEYAIALWNKVLGATETGSIVQGRSPNVLIVRDVIPRVARFRALIIALDEAPRRGERAPKIYVRPVRQLAPSRLAALLEEALAPTLSPGERLRLVPDDVSGRLIVVTQPKLYQRLDGLARRLDVPARDPRSWRVDTAPTGDER